MLSPKDMDAAPMTAPLRLAAPLAALLGSLALAGGAAAQTVGTAGGNELSFTVGVDVTSAPEFPGSDEQEVRPGLTFGDGYLGLGSGLGFGTADPDAPRLGLGISPSFRYVGDREVDADSDFAGLDDVDDTYELGLGLSYEWQNARVFGDVRYGLGGHEGVVGDLGADAIARPTDRLTIAGGPRVFFADDDYAQTYFGVTPEESALGGIEEYDAGGGALGAGAEVTARYRLGGDWGVEGGVRYNRLIGDAGDSPVTDIGSRDQYELRLGLTRRLTLRF